jgi:hypothetical protein
MADVADVKTVEPKAEEDEMAAKRKEIEEKVAALKLARAKEAEQKSTYFGDHVGITCDGCGSGIVGYRYKCKSCANHDVCETCFDAWAGGKGTMTNGLSKQTISSNPADHAFVLHKEKSMKPLVKGGSAPAKAAPKVKPNDPCPCGSGKKYKKCCGAV